MGSFEINKSNKEGKFFGAPLPQAVAHSGLSSRVVDLRSPPKITGFKTKNRKQKNVPLSIDNHLEFPGVKCLLRIKRRKLS